MIRVEEPEGWMLIRHHDHAALAARFATHWGNDEFERPEPRADVLAAVVHHDDAWAVRDALPHLTREGRPSAFSRELVGAYSAFEEMNLEDYLAVRSHAAEVEAVENPYAAVLISMHSVNLLTDEMNLCTLAQSERELIGRFIDSQERRQEEIRSRIGADPIALRRGFELLRACDSLSLTACVRFQQKTFLSQGFPRRNGTAVEFEFTPLGGDEYRILPYPFDLEPLRAVVPIRRLCTRAFASEEAFRLAFAAAQKGELGILIIR